MAQAKVLVLIRSLSRAAYTKVVVPVENELPITKIWKPTFTQDDVALISRKLPSSIRFYLPLAIFVGIIWYFGPYTVVMEWGAFIAGAFGFFVNRFKLPPLQFIEIWEGMPNPVKFKSPTSEIPIGFGKLSKVIQKEIVEGFLSAKIIDQTQFIILVILLAGSLIVGIMNLYGIHIRL